MAYTTKGSRTSELEILGDLAQKLGRFRLKWQKKSNFTQEGQGLAHGDLAYRLEREISRQIGVSGLTYVS